MQVNEDDGNGITNNIQEVCFFYVWNALWCCVISFYIFLRVKCALVLCYISAFGTHSGIVEFRFIFFYVWNMIWYCGILCYIFPRAGRALVLWNSVLYSYACGTRSGVVGFFVIYFPFIESSGGDNSTSLCACVLYFSCCIFCVVLKSLHYLQQLLLISIWGVFGQTLKKTVFS